MPGQITTLSGTLWTGMTTGFSRFMSAIPSLLGAVIILVAGWYISKFVGRMLSTVLSKAKVDSIPERAHISGYLPSDREGRTLRFSEVLGMMGDTQMELRRQSRLSTNKLIIKRDKKATWRWLFVDFNYRTLLMEFLAVSCLVFR